MGPEPSYLDSLGRTPHSTSWDTEVPLLVRVFNAKWYIMIEEYRAMLNDPRIALVVWLVRGIAVFLTFGLASCNDRTREPNPEAL